MPKHATIQVEFSGREVAIIGAVLNRSRKWDDPRELARFICTAAECLGGDGFTEAEMDAIAEKLADVWSGRA